MPKLAVLTAPIHNPITILEYAAGGSLEEITFNIRHKRLTSQVLNRVDEIQAQIHAENKKNVDAQRKIDDAIGTKKTEDQVGSVIVTDRVKMKNTLAAQLEFLIEYTDIVDENDNVMHSSVDTFQLLSINALKQLIDGIFKTSVPSKKSLSNSSNGMSAEDTEEIAPVG